MAATRWRTPLLTARTASPRSRTPEQPNITFKVCPASQTRTHSAARLAFSLPSRLRTTDVKKERVLIRSSLLHMPVS